ncbi:MAG: DivIVA domain-containing protein [Candidatus Nanopelagicales bacterium]
MPIVFAVLALVLIVALALILSGRLPAVPQPTRDRYVARLPEQPSATDVDQLRLPVAFRGYRMDEVDIALATLRTRIATLEAELVAESAPTSSGQGPDQTSPFAPPDSAGDDA